MPVVSWGLEEEGMAWVVAKALFQVHSSWVLEEGGRTAEERELQDEACPGFR